MDLACSRDKFNRVAWHDGLLPLIKIVGRLSGQGLFEIDYFTSAKAVPGADDVAAVGIRAGV